MYQCNNKKKNPFCPVARIDYLNHHLHFDPTIGDIDSSLMNKTLAYPLTKISQICIGTAYRRSHRTIRNAIKNQHREASTLHIIIGMLAHKPHKRCDRGQGTSGRESQQSPSSKEEKLALPKKPANGTQTGGGQEHPQEKTHPKPPMEHRAANHTNPARKRPQPSSPR